jgi:hypothetical protein
MTIDPAGHGIPAPAHMPLPRAGELTRRSRPSAVQMGFQPHAPERTRAPPGRVRSAPPPSGCNIEPHTPVRSSSTEPLDPGRRDGMLNRRGKKSNLKPMFLKAAMLVRSGGDPNAVGDSGASARLFQLHERGHGYGMGDSHFDPETNPDRAAQASSPSAPPATTPSIPAVDPPSTAITSWQPAIGSCGSRAFPSCHRTATLGPLRTPSVGRVDAIIMGKALRVPCSGSRE